MRTKSFRYGKSMCKTYLRSVGNGWETGFVFEGKTVFVGNFIHSTEANRWFTIMNAEISRFGKKYTFGCRLPASWFRHFITNHLYKSYYAFLDRLFMRYTRTYRKAFSKDMRQFQKLKTTYKTWEKTPYLKAA